MGFWVRKRARLFPGIWLNLGKNGLSVSAGFGVIRYRYRLTGSKGKRITKEYEPVPEPTTGEYVGCSIYIVGAIILFVGLFAGFFVKGLYIFIACIVVGSFINIIGKRKPDTLNTVNVTGENSLNEAVANLNVILDRMETSKDRKELSDYYQKARAQMSKLPTSLQLNGYSLEDAKNQVFFRYSELLKKLHP